MVTLRFLLSILLKWTHHLTSPLLNRYLFGGYDDDNNNNYNDNNYDNDDDIIDDDNDENYDEVDTPFDLAFAEQVFVWWST